MRYHRECGAAVPEEQGVTIFVRRVDTTILDQTGIAILAFAPVLAAAVPLASLASFWRPSLTLSETPLSDTTWHEEL